MLIIYAFICATFTDFIDDCLKEGMIFEKWGKIVDGNFWLKPLGGCLVCTNVWINIVLYFILMFYGKEFDFVLLFGQIGLSNYFLKKFVI